ncbi:hypothetical protein BJY01DRAFT_193617 [Aspergillus pseudoustus]|uniref:Uncharacterized protein n=1 Tax=Aspergillus pseudoustus TaxID=1810923 RepID=A0ABR4JTX7_9EURO
MSPIRCGRPPECFPGCFLAESKLENAIEKRGEVPEPWPLEIVSSHVLTDNASGHEYSPFPSLPSMRHCPRSDLEGLSCQQRQDESVASRSLTPLSIGQR